MHATHYYRLVLSGGSLKLIATARATVIKKLADDLESEFLSVKFHSRFVLSSPAGI